jgi:protein-S-isoprenylcysteine O-methyltransferase Ste14
MSEEHVLASQGIDRWDLIERILVVGLYAPLCFNLGTAALAGSWADLILLLSEGTVVFFILVRRFTSDVSMRPRDWLFAAAGTAMPLLVRAGGDGPITGVQFCTPLMVFGFLLQVWAKLTLRRSFGIIAANRGVKIGGPYGFIRHPMYAGYILTQIGFLLLNPTLWNLSVYLVAFSSQIVRILAEERLLAEDPGYRALRQSVRYRLIPGVF